MRKRLLSLIISLCMLAAMLAGCASGSTTPTTAPADQTKPADATAAPSEPATAGEPVALKAIINTHALTKDVTTMAFLAEMEKKTNVKITWEQYKSGWSEKKSVLLASGDVPDLFVGSWTLTDSDISQFKSLFQPLNDMLTIELAPNVTKAFAEHPELKSIATMVDGNIYGLPKYQRYWPKTLVRQMINKQWLDKLNLPIPSTWDELYTTLKAFKTQDPNGNGKADEIPMDWAPGIGGFNALVLVSSYGITASQSPGDGFYVDNGKVKNFFVEEPYKNLVVFLNKLFSEGLVNPEVFTQDYTKFQSVTRSEGAPVVGYTYGWDLTDRFGNEWAPQYVTMGPMKPNASYTGTVTWDYSYQYLNYASACIEMTAKCADKNAAMRFMDLFYDPYYSMQALFGSVGECIKDNGDGTYAVLPPADASMDPGTWKWTSAFADIAPMYMSDSLNLTLGTDMQAIAKQDEVTKAYTDAVDPKNLWPGVFIKYSDEDNTTIANIRTDLLSVFQTKYAEWVTSGGVETQWDDYVKKLNDAGLTECLSIMQKYYDDYISKQ